MVAKAVKRKNSSEPKGADRWCLGADYVPALKVHDVPSAGQASRLAYGGRTVHLLSALERCAFRTFQWQPEVFGIEEQYGLDLERTLSIAEEIGVKHPMVRGKAEPVVMTTDLVVYYRVEDGERRIARSIKPSEELEHGLAHNDRMRRKISRTIEKLEIERRYWEELGVGWAVLTENELPTARTMTIELMLESKLDGEKPQGFWQDTTDRIRDALIGGDGARLLDLQRELQAAGLVDAADFTSCFRHLCASRQLEFDLDRRFSLERPVSDFRFAATEH